MKIIDCYSIEVWDGGSYNNHKFYVATEEEAKRWKAANQYDSYSKKTLVVYDTIEEVSEDAKKKLKEQALLKLTREERMALGFE